MTGGCVAAVVRCCTCVLQLLSLVPHALRCAGAGGGVVMWFTTVCFCLLVVLFSFSHGAKARCANVGTRRSTAKRRAKRVVLRCLLLAMCATAVACTNTPNTVVSSPAAVVAAGQVDYADPQVQAAAKADLDKLRALPFDPHEMARRFDHGINSHLPHGVKNVVDKSEYWTDPLTHLVHHRLPELTEQQFQQLVSVTRKYAQDVTAYSLDQITGYSGDEEPMSIDLGDTKRVFSPPRRNYSPAELDIIESKVEELLKAGVISPVVSSDYACNVVLAAKRAPDGSWSDKRFCVNFIPVNKHTVLDNYGSHKAESLLQNASTKPYLTALDLRSGFHQLLMKPSDVTKTCFWYVRKNLPPVLMAYNRMPFGLKNASAKFQRVMDHELAKHGCTDFAFAYIDDLIIASDTWEEHVEHVGRVLAMLKACNLKIHPAKSIFGSNVLEYLGHNVVGRHGITMNEAKVAAISALPVPTNLLELRSIVGFMSYYRHFIPGFSSIVEPMVRLMRKDVPYVWGAEQKASYATLRGLMTRPGILLRPIDPKRELILHTDWSVHGIGAVLGQLDDDGNEYLCACISRSLNKHERNYPSYKGELLALTWAVQSFRANLHGLHFRLCTDHRPLLWLMSTRDLNGQYARWQMMLQEFDFEVVHRAGIKHQNADVLSRFPQLSEHDPTGAQLDVFEHPHIAVAMMGVSVPLLVSGIDDFCPSFDSLLGPGYAHHDPVYYSYQVMGQSGNLADPQPGEELELGGDRAAEQASCRDQVAQQCMLAMSVSKGTIREAVAAAAADVVTAPPVAELDRRVAASTFFPWVQDNGLTLIELCGGMCTGLEAVLLAGFRVNTYLYSDIDPLARRVAQFRVNNLVAQYPNLITPDAVAHMFALPQDVQQVQLHDIVSVIGHEQQQVLVMAGWPCQDYSAAGLGRVGHRASLLEHVLRIITGLQATFLSQPVAYLLENVATQHNFNHAHIRHQVTEQLQAQLGAPVEFDAAHAGSYAARLRNYWTNLAPQPVQQLLCRNLRLSHNGDLYDVLGPGRHPMPVADTERRHNQFGHVRRVWPTLMAYHQSRSFVPGQPGCVYDANTDCLTEPSADERELAMGFERSCTAAPNVTELERCTVLGQAIDLNALFVLLQSAVTLHKAGVAVVRAHRPTVVPGTSGCMATMCPPKARQEGSCITCMATTGAPQPPPTLADAAEAAAPHQNDVWLDQPVMHYLRTGSVAIVGRKGLRRAKSYMWFNNRVHRVMSDRYTGFTTYRQVPPPSDRDQIVLEMHVSIGHLGEKRTIAAMATLYWWYGMSSDVRRVLSGCKLCARVRASGGHAVRDMQTEPASEYGLFHRWGLDYAQGLPTSALGNKHCLIMIDYFSKWVEAIPVKDLSAETTTNAFHLHVCARFGLPAEVITDNGSAFKGAFAEFCAKKFIHARHITEDLPRSNGLAERAVQTIKAALCKHAADRHNALTWDTEGLTAILTGYRCTPQASTGHSPARILFALDPVLDAEQVYARRGHMDLGADVSPEQLAADLLLRSRVVAEVGVSVAHNLRTAHERDCRRFKARRSGLYVPRVHHFHPGDFVFVLSQGQVPGGALGIQARNEVLKVLEVRASGVLLLQNQAGRTVEKHLEHCVPCMLPNLIGDTYAGLVKPQADLPCQVCHDHRHWESMLLCDHCDLGWHTYCLEPPLEDVPEGRWLCPDCIAAGMTLELLAQKHDRLVADEESRPALELPSRTRIAKARALASEWHGEGVLHVHKGKARFGRVVFRGVLERKWFRVDWEDGTSSIHNGSMLRHLHLVDDGELPAGVPPKPPPVVVMWAVSASQLARLPDLCDPDAVVQYLDMLISGPSCEPEHALGIMCAVTQSYALRANPPFPAHTLDALKAVLHLPALHTVLAPLDCADQVAEVFQRPGVLAFSNHPHSLSRASTHLNPFAAATHEFYAAGDGIDAYFLNVQPYLLDVMLPMAVMYASMAVIALVPVSYMFPAPPCRAAWLADEVWSTGRGLFLRIVQENGLLCSHGWLIIFAEPSARVRLLQGRVDTAVSDCTWDSRLPHQLARSGSLAAMWKSPLDHQARRPSFSPSG